MTVEENDEREVIDVESWVLEVVTLTEVKRETTDEEQSTEVKRETTYDDDEEG